MPFDIASPQFGLADAKIATWNATNDYGTEVDVMSVQLLGVTMQTVSADLTGDDQITATASRACRADRSNLASSTAARSCGDRRVGSEPCASPARRCVRVRALIRPPSAAIAAR